MGSLLASKKAEKLEINYFLFENYKKYLNIDSNFIDVESLPQNMEAIGGSFSLCCCNFRCPSNWKDHFMERTEKMKEKFDWVSEMRNFIKKLIICKEEAFVSRFSWRLFIALNKPSIKSEMMSETNIENINNNKATFRNNCLLIEQCPFLDKRKPKRTISSSSKNSCKKSKSSLKQLIQESVFNSRADLFFDRKEMKKNCGIVNRVYQMMTDELESHLLDKTNGLSALRTHFTDHFLKSLDKFEESRNQNKESFEEIVLGLKVFLKIFTECLMIYYKLEELGEYVNKSFKSQNKAFKYDNFLVFVTNLIFTTEMFEKLLTFQRKFVDREEEILFSEKMEKLKGKEIEAFEVPVQFALNENTAQNILKQSYRNGPISPYEELISSLKICGGLKSPFWQFKKLVEISQSISKEINDFYENFENKCSEIVDTDTLISLHIYIIVKSGVKELISMLNLMERFASEKQKMELPGYFLTLYRASIEFIKGVQC